MKRSPVYRMILAVLALCVVLGMGVVSLAQETPSVESQNLETAQVLIDDTVIGAKLQDFGEIFANSVRVHSPTGDVYADFPAAVWGQILTGRLGSDEVVTLEHLAAQDDIVFAHLIHEGTFENSILTPGQHNVEPNGDFMQFNRVLVMRFEDGKIVEMWDYANNPLWAVDYAEYLPYLETD